MGVLNSLKVTITNYDENKVEYLEIENNSENPSLGTRLLPFSKTLYIEREDFMENPIKGFHRLSPGKEVRLKGAYFLKCEDIVKDPSTGEITELLCSYDPETKSGSGFTGRKVKGTIHWVSANHGIKAEVHLYDKLISDEELLKDNSKSWEERINPTSLIKLKNCILEPSLKNAPIESKYQFIRHGYFCVDKKYTSKNLVFNRIVPLKDSWNKK